MLKLTGEFFFKLLNPAISLVFTSIFLLLWYKQRAYTYLPLLACAFALSGIAFALNDFLTEFEGPTLRIIVNGLFLASVLMACITALIRVNSPVPKAIFATICVAGSAAFGWYLIGEPSTYARVFVVNGLFAALAIVTGWTLLRAGPKSKVDWLFVCFAMSILLLAIARPTALVTQSLDINSAGSITASEYWATVRALTPLLALVLALSFIAAFVGQLISELRDEAEHDFLSGLLNRRGFDTRATADLAMKSVGNWQPAVMITDIDNFKVINDTFGHSIGDNVIAAIGKILANHSRADIVGRLGGEEFALYYKSARRSELLAHAAAIRAEIGRAAILGVPRGHPLTVSIGIHHRHQTETLSALISHADAALYCAKAAGKDQAVITPLQLRPIDRAVKYMIA